MDDLLREFLTETSESLDTVDNQLVRFEQEPNNAKILDNIFRLVHTIKGTCGFLGLPRLEALAHAGETLMGKFRDGMPVTAEAVTLILSSIDRIKEILAGLEATEAEPEGTDQDLIVELEAMVERGMAEMSETPAVAAQPEPAAVQGSLAAQTLQRHQQLGGGHVADEGLDVAPVKDRVAAKIWPRTSRHPTPEHRLRASVDPGQSPTVLAGSQDQVVRLHDPTVRYIDEVPTQHIGGQQDLASPSLKRLGAELVGVQADGARFQLCDQVLADEDVLRTDFDFQSG